MTDIDTEYDVVIVGAGPAGCACALALKDSGLRVAMMEQHSFPRDKICGDAIPGRAIKVLNSIDPSFANQFKQFPHKCATKTATIHYKGKEVTFNWVLEAYTCARMDFDNFLFELVKANTKTEIRLNTAPVKAALRDGFMSITTHDATVRTKLVIGADGAHSVIAKQLTTNAMDRHHHIGSVRAYFSNVAIEGTDNVAVYFDNQYLPSYLWIFPLPGNIANVGFGMLSSEIARQRIDIKKVFHEFIQRSPILKGQFASARQESKLQGFGLPLGSRVQTVSGGHFMLAGDAASLIDPITGDGIGNAMLSGRLAAEQAIRCFATGDFGAAMMSAYDRVLMGKLGKELRVHYTAQRVLSRMPFLLDAVFVASRNKYLKRIIQNGL